MPAFAQKQRWWEFLSFDRVILLVIVTLMALGLLNLRNADFYSADSFHERQLKWYLLGTVVALMVSAIDLHIVSRLSYVAYGLCIIALIAVLFTDPINNSRRWLSIPGMQQAVQPSEFVKLAVVLALSRWYHDQRHRGSDGPTHWLRRLIRPLTPFLLIVAPVILIFWEPDLGTALIVLLIGLSVIFFEGVRWRSPHVSGVVVAATPSPKKALGRQRPPPTTLL